MKYEKRTAHKSYWLTFLVSDNRKFKGGNFKIDIIKDIEHEQLKEKIPDLKVGNTVKVHVRIKEGNKERIQIFEGIIIKVQGAGVNKTFTVRKISYGVGVEKTFLIHSPLVEKVELVRVGKARRAKLFYLRDRVGKSAKTKELIGARIEDKEIIIKGEEAPVEEAVKTEETATEVVKEKPAKAEETSEKETVEVKETPVEEAVKEEPVKAEETSEKETAEVKEASEKKAE